VIAQREFRGDFGIHRNRDVPSAHGLKSWVRNFEDTGSTLKKKGGSVKTVRTPENIAGMREAINPQVTNVIYIYIYIYIYDIRSLRVNDLSLILLTWRKW
jgi:hypothetical protein